MLEFLPRRPRGSYLGVWLSQPTPPPRHCYPALDMANNLVLLPARMGDVDVGALGQQLVADGAVTDPG